MKHRFLGENVTRFSLEDFSLSQLFCTASIAIDSYALGLKTTDPYYNAIIRAGKILYKYGQEQKSKVQGHPEKINPFEDIFLLNAFQEIGKDPRTIEDVLDSTIQIGLDLIKLRELSIERQKELRDICVLFSRNSRNHWLDSGYSRHCYVA